MKLSLWFIRLRWFSFLGQAIILVSAAGFFKLSLPVERIAGLILLIPITNLICSIKRISQISEFKLVGTLLSIDTILLTAVLYNSGGPTNPFTIFYLLHVVLAAIMLSPPWIWSITALSSFCFSSLFVYSIPVPEWDHHGAHHGFSLHLHGMLFAYIVASLLVAYFLNRIYTELKTKESRLHKLETIAANQKKLATLTTITANAAHELGTPLATIALISHELLQTLAKRLPEKDILEDLELLKKETFRCKKLIQDLSEKTGDIIGEPLIAVSIKSILDEAGQPLKLSASNVVFKGNLQQVIPNMPRSALVLAMRAILKNALDASKENPRIIVNVESTGTKILIKVEDHGIGMDAETLSRMGEPFFSTKEFGNGMGLGVYISKLTLDQIGGKIEYHSEPNQGTVVEVSIPLKENYSNAA